MTCNYDPVSVPLKVLDPNDFSGLDPSSESSSSTRGRKLLIDFSRHKATDVHGRSISRSRSRSRSQNICRDPSKHKTPAPLQDAGYFLKDARSRSRSRSNSVSRHSRSKSETIPTYVCQRDSLLGDNFLGHDSFAYDSEEEEFPTMTQSERLPSTTSRKEEFPMMAQSERFPSTTSRTSRGTGYEESMASLGLLDLEFEDDDEEEEPAHRGYPMPTLGNGSRRSSPSLAHLSKSASTHTTQERIVIPSRRRGSMGASTSTELMDSSCPTFGSAHGRRSSIPCRPSPLPGRSKSLGSQEAKDKIRAQFQKHQSSGEALPSVRGRFRQNRRRSSLGYGSMSDSAPENSDDNHSSSTSSQARRPRRSKSMVGASPEHLLMASMSSLTKSKSTKALPPRSKTVSYTTTRGKQQSGASDELLGSSNHGFLTGSRIKRTILDGSQTSVSLLQL